MRALRLGVWLGLVAVVLTLAVRPAEAATGDPIGRVDSASARMRGNPAYEVHPMHVVFGWAADPDAPGEPVQVAVQLDGLTIEGYGTSTGEARPDVHARYPFAGPNSGWSAVVERSGRFCFYALNHGPGGKTDLGCVQLPQPGSSSRDPVGRLDEVTAAPGLLRVRGWVGDGDGGRLPLRVRVYLDESQGTEVEASAPRGDVAAAHPELGARTGFDVLIPIIPGRQRVCVYAGNLGRRGNNNLKLGCPIRTVPGVQPRAPGDPDGRFEAYRVSYSGGPSGLHQLRGWAFDPSSPGPWQVRIRYITWRSIGLEPPHSDTVTTSASRPDVYAAYPAAGPNSGWAHEFSGFPEYTDYTCAYAVGAGPGAAERFIGCRRGYP